MRRMLKALVVGAVWVVVTAAIAVAATNNNVQTWSHSGAGISDLAERVAGVDGAYVAAGEHLVVTAFRTKAGAEGFVDMVRAIRSRHVAGDLLVAQVRRTAGDAPIGLGQEAHPDGSGPLYDELAGQAAYQG